MFRHSADEFLLTAAEPNLAYFHDLVGYDCGSRSTTSPSSTGRWRSRAHAPTPCLSQLAPEVEPLGYFDHTPAKLGNVAGRRSRAPDSPATSDTRCSATAGDAPTVWDMMFEAGAPHGMLPFGQTALLMARIEAGLLLIHVDFDASRLAENDEHRSTPLELGLQWMLKGIDDDSRPFIGRKAILREHAEGTSRWKMMGLMVDPFDYHRKYTDAGMVPPKDHTPGARGHDGVRRRRAARRLRHELHVLAGAAAPHRARPDPARPGQGRARSVNLEFTINHRYVQVGAHVARNPMFAPARKTQMMASERDA